MSSDSTSSAEQLPTDDTSPYFVAVDLGSNSFHMLIAKETNGQLDIIDRVKDMVQIARGVDENGRLAPEAIERALVCLACFRERIQQIPASQVRAVGTKALRMVENAQEFLAQAENTLGHPIQIISGYEEARLIYTGVSHTLANDPVKRLVIDIGGGSTEFIIGKKMRPWLMESLSIGCVTYTERFFRKANGKITQKMMRNAYLQTCEEMELILKKYKRTGWEMAIGTSGTMRAIAEGMPNQSGGGLITAQGLNELYQSVIDTGSLQMAGVTQQRLDVLPAGIAILKAIVDQFELQEVYVATATLKEGLIFETLGRLNEKDIREVTVEDLMIRYRADTKQARRVHRMALHFFKQLEPLSIVGVNIKKLLKWGAKLHEIGLNISHSGYHSHGYYLLENSDLAGFTQFEQQILSLLVGCHRRKFKSDLLEQLNSKHLTNLLPVIIALRLAVLLNRRREKITIKPSLNIQDKAVKLGIDAGWLDQHLLTQRSLAQESSYLAKIGYSLWINDSQVTEAEPLTATTKTEETLP